MPEQNRESKSYMFALNALLLAEEMMVCVFDPLLDKLACSWADEESTSFGVHLHQSEKEND